jgi:anti-sigma regulatory factor (Ser/Thr protein kinase)
MITYSAELENLGKFIQFAGNNAEQAGFAPDELLHIELAMEECIVNIMNYAFSGKPGDITVECSVLDNGIEITVSDNGTPFNPLKKEDPDLTLPIEERKVGGLGIYLVKNLMDEISYSRGNGSNVLVMKKYKG